ncbi:putative C6 finger domain protein [Aspergillus campestris IBT 28561]|uniref:C6 finger domain protein n=1 Tax=Aspergillus campestris (strain IBT 28561) TaxID=1392248 RepID=A0A2I1CYG3_ASPC2|nr:putative C6 finger domain protein [Aspergillus campestris IBT 28561]PKY02669.1 putative C6 finger domain protein [Aspergillus campestris IBT 28561]
MSNVDISSDGFIGLDYDSRNYLQPQSWPVTVDHQASQRADGARDVALQTSGLPYEQSVSQDPNLMVDWHFHALQPHLQYSPEEASSVPQFTTASYGMSIQSSPIDLMSNSQGQMSTSLLGGSYLPLSPPVDMNQFPYHDFQADLMPFPDAVGDVSSYAAPHNVIDSSSPTDTALEVRSLSSSDNGWCAIEPRHSHEFSFPDQGFFINPSQTLHDRSLSESSYSTSYSSFIDVTNPVNSPSSDTNFESAFNTMNRRVSFDHTSHGSQSPTAVSPVAIARPIPVPVPMKKPSSPARSAGSQASSASPPSRKPSRKSPIAAKSETKIRKHSQSGKPETEKRVGKRKGPLKPDQRKQASEIRKLRACLRCKFLKKTCDKGEPCAGCQPSHARLWQVPCTRIDIKEIGYFMKDWKADYERHISLGFSVGNIKGFSDHERTLFITHGYGQVLPINAREVYVRDEQCFSVDWVESMHREPTQYEVETAKLSAGMEGISHALLSDYLDRHIDGNGTFEKFVDDYFEGTPFLTQMLKTAFRYYFRTKLPVIRKALKLVVAYNLTLHVTMVEGLGDEEGLSGKINSGSKFSGKTMAPVMINFQIKCAMANMWRELQKDVLEELSGLYSSVYSGDKLKNWPTIFILASILLAVWEEMQFDSHYRTPDASAVDKFCTDMETTPVGVIVGLFQAISQKLPAFTDWETQKHHHLLHSNPDVCNTMTEVRQHVTQYETYLRSRSGSKFNRNDFDCLSNKFISRLVIRAN